MTRIPIGMALSAEGQVLLQMAMVREVVILVVEVVPGKVLPDLEEILFHHHGVRVIEGL